MLREKKRKKTMQEPKLFLPKKGNYQDLASYKKATVIYDLTFYFAKRFLDKGDRTIDQMVQAARSGKQNIAEGCAAAATSAETELKLVNVARASMKELLVDYEDYLRVRRLTKWAFDDERTRKTREFCKTHESSDDFMRGIDKRSDEAIANITITLLHQFDNIIGAYIAHLEKTFVEQGGIRERMTAARLGYRNDQKTCIAELEAENSRLKARIAELEEKLKGLSLISLISLIGLIGHIGLIGQGLIGLMILGLTSCSGSSDDDLQESQPETNSDMVAITFNGSGGAETAVTRADGTPLSEEATSFTVWGYKNMSSSPTQTVFPSYVVNWTSNSAGTTTSNSSGWEYVAQTPNQTIKFWDWSAKAYRFFAVTGWSGEEPPTPPATYAANKTYGANETYGPAGAYKAYGVSIAANASDPDVMAVTPYFSRLWFSTGNPAVYPDKQFGKPVVLEFLKPYARVRFIFKYVYPREGIELTNKMFRPTSDVGAAEEDKVKIARKGVVTVHFPTEGTEIKEWYSVEVDDDKSTRLSAFTEDYDPEDDGKKCWYTVLPNNTQGSYTMSVTVNKDEKPKTAVVPANYMQWLPGYSYTYVFKITEEGGVEIGWVESAVTPWNEMEASWTVYNW